jgi:hypothetical protein
MKKVTPKARNDFDYNISNSAENTPISNEKARQYGRNMAILYKTNKGSLDAFYRLLATVETSFEGEARFTFLNSFFDVLEVNQEGGADEEYSHRL